MSRSLVAAFSLVVAACAVSPASVGPSSIPPTVATTSTTQPPPTSTTSSSSTTTTTSTKLPDLPEIDAEVHLPVDPGPHPAVVLVHGGGWVAGSPASLRRLAGRLADEGFLVVNTRYRLSTLKEPGFPQALHDVACAVRYAAAHPDSDGTVSVVGHSAGAHLAAVVAATGTLYGEGCPVSEPAEATGLVGLAGPYDVVRLGVIVFPFFGVALETDPDAWAAGNPHGLTGAAAVDRVLLIHGAEDGIVDVSFSVDFGDDLAGAGIGVTVEIIPGADHLDVADPDHVGDLIVSWLRAR